MQVKGFELNDAPFDSSAQAVRLPGHWEVRSRDLSRFPYPKLDLCLWRADDIAQASWHKKILPLRENVRLVRCYGKVLIAVHPATKDADEKRPLTAKATAERDAARGFTDADLAEVMDNPEWTDEQLRTAKPFAEVFPHLSVPPRRSRKSGKS